MTTLLVIVVNLCQTGNVLFQAGQMVKLEHFYLKVENSIGFLMMLISLEEKNMEE